jgi:hypothetical protein
MPRLTAEDRRGRRVLDFRVLTAMGERCPLIDVEAYASAGDLRARRNRITDPASAHRAAHYRIAYRIKTLTGPGRFADETVIHIDAETANYPFTAPASWVLTEVPYSPHFKAGTVVCIGDLWDPSGRTLLGHLVRHHAKLLNWDERARGGGYVGWNGAAIAYHRSKYGSKPLTPGVAYPEIPEDVAYGIAAEATEVADDLFGGAARRGRPAAPSGLFAGAGRRSS